MSASAGRIVDKITPGGTVECACWLFGRVLS